QGLARQPALAHHDAEPDQQDHDQDPGRDRELDEREARSKVPDRAALFPLEVHQYPTTQNGCTIRWFPRMPFHRSSTMTGRRRAVWRTFGLSIAPSPSRSCGMPSSTPRAVSRCVSSATNRTDPTWLWPSCGVSSFTSKTAVRVPGGQIAPTTLRPQ